MPGRGPGPYFSGLEVVEGRGRRRRLPGSRWNAVFLRGDASGFREPGGMPHNLSHSEDVQEEI